MILSDKTKLDEEHLKELEKISEVVLSLTKIIFEKIEEENLSDWSKINCLGLLFQEILNGYVFCFSEMAHKDFNINEFLNSLFPLIKESTIAVFKKRKQELKSFKKLH